MKQKVYKFFSAALLYWSVATFTGYFAHMPDVVAGIAIFIPPILGLMWGVEAAVGVYFGALFSLPDFNNFFLSANNMTDRIFYFAWSFRIFLAGYLPGVLWRKILIRPEGKNFFLDLHTLKKFIAVMFLTFLATSIFRTVTVTGEELQAVTGLLGSGKTTTILTYTLACFANDFFTAIFFDLFIFFFLVSREFNFYESGKIANDSDDAPDEKSSNETGKAWLIAAGFYALFPISVAYICRYQIYGMDNLNTWLNFVVECLSMIDVYLVLMIYLMLRYRRSIMLEVVFLTTQTVFLSAAVLGLGSSAAIGDIVRQDTENSLRSMSVICRERLYRTFLGVQQSVKGMKLQVENGIESYDKLANDSAYRKNYLARMKKDLGFVAMSIDGVISYYLRFIPEIEGTKGGFSMQRADTSWEGTFIPFDEREPIDLAPFDPDDAKHVGWYYIPMKSRCPTWIEPYFDAVTDYFVISYVAPLFVEKKFVGVVGMDIDFNFIIHELRRMSIYDYDYVYITDRNGIVLYHSLQPQGSVFQPDPEFQEIEVYLINGMWLGIATPLAKVHDARNKILMNLIAAVILVAMLISIVSVSLAAKAIKPLSGMTEAAKRIASGDLNVKISYESGNELGILVRSIREMAAKLEVYVYRDKLTGLRNAAAYTGKAAELDSQKDSDPNLAYGVIIFDANFLKKVNDQYGHDAGNLLLRHAAKVIRKVFTNSPAYRVGGDEFAVILEGSDYENRQALLRLFDAKIAAEHFKAGGDILSLSVARGLGVYEPGMEFSSVSKRADVAMYNHKTFIKSKFGEEVR